MKLDDTLPRVKLTIANIIWPNKKIITFKDFLSEAINFMAQKNITRFCPYNKVELSQMFIEMVDNLDKDLKEGIVDVFFIDFVKHSVSLNDFETSSEYKNMSNVFNLDKIENVNKFVLHRDLIINSKNEKYCDFLLNVLHNEICNEMNVFKCVNIISDINYLNENNNKILHQLETYKYTLLKRLVKENDILSIEKLLKSKNDILLTALKEPDLLSTMLDLSLNLMKKENMENCFAFFIKVIKDMPKNEKKILLEKINVKSILTCSKYSLENNELDIIINKKELFLLNYWNSCFKDILVNDSSSNYLEKQINKDKSIPELLLKGLDSKIIEFNKITKDENVIIINFKFNESYNNDNKENICTFLNIEIKNLFLDFDNIDKKEDIFSSSFEKMLMSMSPKNERSKLKIKKF